MDSYTYYDRDLSWISFNQRVLMEAQDPSLPLYERLKFMGIYSSNLDEFFRVRVASVRSLSDIGKKKINKQLKIKPGKLLKEIHNKVNTQLEEYGKTLREDLLPKLLEHHIHIYMGDQDIPPDHKKVIDHYFKSKVLSFLHPAIIDPKHKENYFLNNRALYFALRLKKISGKKEPVQYAYLNIPSENLPRFLSLPQLDGCYCMIFLDDIIRNNLEFVFAGHEIQECASIKLNRDADLNIEDEYSGDLVDKIKKQITKRNIGVPSRFLYDNKISEQLLDFLVEVFELNSDDLVPGGRYHNLNDLMKLPNPLKPQLEAPKLSEIQIKELDQCPSIFDSIAKKDHMLHFPYHSYDYVLRFFNEAAVDPFVQEIKVTLYRIAADSLIAHALISAAKNGKDVTVFVEVKARFDEENNIRWAQKMEEAGIRIIYSIPGLKVHAKVALIKRKDLKGKAKYFSFLGTGNFNEVTAGIYADHGLLTCHPEMMEEVEKVFKYLYRRKDPGEFKHILVSQFNLQSRFLEMIDREIAFARNNKPGRIILKFNNLEDKVMINKLYEASNLGVTIDLLLRGICCLVPGVEGQSENIQVRRLVDGFLEHARVFWFHNNGKDELYAGSSDWMKRNLYHRIEVIYPIYDTKLKQELIKIIEWQLKDNVKATLLDQNHHNVAVPTKPSDPAIRAQTKIYEWLKNREEEQVLTD